MICPGCKEDKELIPELWPRNKNTSNGFAFYCKLCHNRKGRESRDRQGGTRTYHLKRRYGITADEADVLMAQQGNRCAICMDSFEDVIPHVDHCHKTGRVRGILCSSCNQGLGNFKDDYTRLQWAADYLAED
jgi:hypothetical protein